MEWRTLDTFYDRITRGKKKQKKEGRQNAGGRTDAAFQKSFYESHMWPPSPLFPALYSWHRVTSLLTLRSLALPRTTITLTIPSPHAHTSRSLARESKRWCREEHAAFIPDRPSHKLCEEFFFHIHWGVIVRRNLTNFQPSTPPATRDTPSLSFARMRI